jgi:nucleotide-binding universal stress UspA family protein
MLDLILVPLDGSEAAEVAVRVAAQLPAQRILLASVEPDCTDLAEPCPGVQEWETYLASVATALRQQGRDVTTRVAVGDPATQIIAMTRSADFIVMSSHGRGAMGRLMFGSVADAVIRRAATPTLIVRGEHWSGTALRRIVVPLDGSPLAEHALPMAVNLARGMQIPVHLVRVVDFDQVQASVLAGPAAAEACARQQAELAREASSYLARLSAQYQATDCEITTDVRIGTPIGELLTVIQPEDLTVLATHARGGIARWFMGSVAEAIVRRSAGPVLLVRAGAGKPTNW